MQMIGIYIIRLYGFAINSMLNAHVHGIDENEWTHDIVK